MRRVRLDAVLAAALCAGTVTLAGAVPEGEGSLATLRIRLRRLFAVVPRVGRARDFLAILYLLLMNCSMRGLFDAGDRMTRC